MSVPARLALFAAVLTAAFGAAALAGGAVDPGDPTPERSASPHAATGGGHEEQEAAAAPVGEGHGRGHDAGASPPAVALPGLAAEQDGLAFALDTTRAERGGRIAFRILDAEGRAVRDFDLAHEKRMHLVVVRRDLASFEHLHPTMDADGRWSVRAGLGAPGTYRVYADFTRGGTQRTLGRDLHVPGAFTARPLAAPAVRVRDDAGLDVRLVRDGGRVAFEVRRDGRLVNAELEPYLGAQGHLVSLRASDLAYLHTHPDGDELAFEVEAPSPGTYRHHVQFRLDGRVHTAAFTEEVAR
jgi:hypothetical protein